MEQEILELKKDIALFFKYYALCGFHADFIKQKNGAVRNQDFERAAHLRDEENKIFVGIIAVCEELKEISKKYLPESPKTES